MSNRKYLIETTTFRGTVSEPVNPDTLGVLKGIFADATQATINNHDYSLAWAKACAPDAPIQEAIKLKRVLGKNDHPKDLEDTTITGAAISTTKIVNRDGVIYGEADILPTNEGKHLKILLDYGFVPGISTRGAGETYIDDRGVEVVDPDSYLLFTFDVVVNPACYKANPEYLSESVAIEMTNSMKLSTERKKKLLESIQNCKTSEDLDIYRAVVGHFGLDKNKQFKTTLTEAEEALTMLPDELIVDDELVPADVPEEPFVEEDAISDKPLTVEEQIVHLTKCIEALEQRIDELTNPINQPVNTEPLEDLSTPETPLVEQVKPTQQERRYSFGYQRKHQMINESVSLKQKYPLNESRLSSVTTVKFGKLNLGSSPEREAEIDEKASLYSKNESNE